MTKRFRGQLLLVVFISLTESGLSGQLINKVDSSYSEEITGIVF